MNRYRSLSLWHDTISDITPRSPLDGAVAVDVAIVGGGFTGLWTAYYLKRLQPDLSIAVIERETAGFGASGRNGGWASGEFAVGKKLVVEHGQEAVNRLYRMVFASIDEIGRVLAAEGITADFAKGGTLTFATSPAQRTRLQAMLAREERLGFGEDDYRWLDQNELETLARCEPALGAVFTPHCAAIHPAKAVRGLAEVVERLGVRIFERTAALSIEGGKIHTASGDVNAGSVIQSTEAFGVSMPGQKRRLAPVYSLMVATEPLPDHVWEEIGLADRPTFNDARHLIIYGQRTADGRLAFGGRGAPYHYGSAMAPSHEQNPVSHANIAKVLRWLFPQLREAGITHTWGGAVAVPRDWTAAITFDPGRRMGWVGGYVGSGVTATNLAGRTMADLVLGRDTDLVHLPWVGHRSPSWEPEPFRYLGINLARRLAPWADAAEFRSGRPSKVFGGLLESLTSH